MKKVPLWSKEASKILIDKGMNKKELATAVKVNYNQLCNVMSGYVANETVKASICAYLGIDNDRSA